MRNPRQLALLMMIVFTTVALLPLLPAASSEPQIQLLHRGSPAPSQGALRLRLVTYNVLLFRGTPKQQSSPVWNDDEKRIEAFARVFESLDADVFAIQEAPSARWLRALAEKLNFHAARTHETGYGGGALLSRFPILEFVSYKDRRDDVGKVFTRHFWRALVDLGGGERIMVYGTHLEPRRDIAGEIRRLREIDMILTIMQEEQRPGVSQVLMGDFNNALGESMFRPMLNRGLRDAWMVRPDGGMNTANSIQQYCRVDRIFIPGTWSDSLVGAGAVRNRETSPMSDHVTFVHSDHLPVRADIVLNAVAPSIDTTRHDDLVIHIGDVNYTLRWVSPGTFAMGHDSGPMCYQPQREVTIGQGYWMLEHEVSNRLWRDVMGASAVSGDQDSDLPVVNVSHEDCRRFLDRLNVLMPGYSFSLPSEAQWEYAARGGRANIPDAVLLGNAEHNQPPGHRAALKPVQNGDVNDWGIIGMLGNVREWCRDTYHEDALTFLPNRDPLHRDELAWQFSLRGSSYLHESGGGIVARVGASSDHRDAITGFRFVAVSNHPRTNGRTE